MNSHVIAHFARRRWPRLNLRVRTATLAFA